MKESPRRIPANYPDRESCVASNHVDRRISRGDSAVCLQPSRVSRLRHADHSECESLRGRSGTATRILTTRAHHDDDGRRGDRAGEPGKADARSAPQYGRTDWHAGGRRRGAVAADVQRWRSRAQGSGRPSFMRSAMRLVRETAALGSPKRARNYASQPSAKHPRMARGVASLHRRSSSRGVKTPSVAR
jgi:hypothetical protein